MHQDVLDGVSIINFEVFNNHAFNSLFISLRIELTTPDTKQHKIDGIFKIIKTTQAIIIVEFSFARKEPETKEDGDQVKLCRNSMRILNKILLQGVPKNKARVYLIQAVSEY